MALKAIRMQHNEAIRRLLVIQDFEKQKEMVNVLSAKLQDLLKKNKKIIGQFYSVDDLIATSIADEETRIGINTGNPRL